MRFMRFMICPNLFKSGYDMGCAFGSWQLLPTFPEWYDFSRLCVNGKKSEGIRLTKRIRINRSKLSIGNKTIKKTTSNSWASSLTKGWHEDHRPSSMQDPRLYLVWPYNKIESWQLGSSTPKNAYSKVNLAHQTRNYMAN